MGENGTARRSAEVLPAGSSLEEQAGVGTPPPVSPGRERMDHLTMAELRHPIEPSRFALALVALAVPVAVAAFVMISLGQATLLVAIFVLIVFVVLLLWLTLQLVRIRLLGDAVLVSHQTLPEVQDVVDAVRSRLAYTRRVDVFVVDKVSRVLAGDSAPITMTSYFGVHVLVAEGDALGDLVNERDRQQLLFTLASYVGALKARYAQWWSPLLTAFTMTGLSAFVGPFIYPYYRATVYSGDRIAYACCGDLDVSLQAVYRALVGKDVAAHLRAEGLTSQALVARRRLLLRFAQLLRPTPHATNRYLQLLAFVSQTTPVVFAEHVDSFGTAGQGAARVLAAMRRKRGHPAVVAIGVLLAIAVLTTGVLLGVAFRNSPVAQTIAEIARQVTADPADEGAAPTSATSPAEPTADATARAAGERLLGLVPPDVQSSCAIDAVDPAAQASGSITCQAAVGQPQLLWLVSYASAEAMSAELDDLVGTPESDDCTTRPSRGEWSLNGVLVGELACFASEAGNTIVWGSDAQGVLVLAADQTWSPEDLYVWWQNDAPFLQ